MPTGAASASSRSGFALNQRYRAHDARRHFPPMPMMRASGPARCRRAVTAPRWCWARSIPTNAACSAAPASRATRSVRAWCRMKAPAASGGPAACATASRPGRRTARGRVSVHAAHAVCAGTHAGRWLVTGVVQGVGFRPFVYRLAEPTACAAGCETAPARSKSSPPAAKPVAAFEEHCQAGAGDRAPRYECRGVARATLDAFEILASDTGGDGDIHVPADISSAKTVWRN